MAKPYVLPNEVQSTIATGNTWTRGTDTSIVLTDASDFDSGGGYIRIGNTTSYALMEYTGISTNTLTGLTACTSGVVVSSGDTTKEWPAGTVVSVVFTAEKLGDLQTELDTAIHDNVSGEIVAVTEKTSPVPADELLIEDSASSNAKKSLKILNINANNPSCKVYDSTGATISTATITTLSFDSESWDLDTMHDNSTNPERITFTTAGKYLIYTIIEWGVDATGDRGLYIRLNGTTRISGNVLPAPASNKPRCIAVAIIDASASDYVEARVYQDSGGDLDVLSGANAGDIRPAFAAYRIG